MDNYKRRAHAVA